MKLLKKQISEKDGAGSVVLRAEDPEDMWHTYNLIHVGDSVKTTTMRKVGKEGVTGPTSSRRVHMTLQIEVEQVNVDPVLGVLRIRGKWIIKSQNVSGTQCKNSCINRDFALTKAAAGCHAAGTD
ncbi:unnamed protein product [Hyaloperonospora brassicae]|uniref:eRF1/Pelota-like N-terminal domain-containing protein n=1 Tax=Hyaloperonospora brassicae TaxID=162125 RepID=A0AAV0UZ84_HYABA|nr:unnamed protein product [Hyaloperonospora brassicae]